LAVVSNNGRGIVVWTTHRKRHGAQRRVKKARDWLFKSDRMNSVKQLWLPKFKRVLLRSTLPGTFKDRVNLLP
jgi:hypothetical protein